MDSTPLRDPESYISAFVMSKIQLISIVEGKSNDPFVYEKLYSSVIPAHLRCEVVQIDEIGLTELGFQPLYSGKDACLALFERLNGTGFLKGKEGSIKYFVLFNLDKDVDDHTQKIMRSNHIIYTEYYDLEAQVYFSNTVIGIIQEGTSITLSVAAKNFGGIDWFSVIESWSDWHEYAFVNEVLGVGEAGYSKGSIFENQTNNGASFRKNAAAKIAFEGRFTQKLRDLGLSEHDFQRAVSKINAKETRLKTFKGKWVPILLARQIGSVSIGVAMDTDNMVVKFGACVKSFGKLMSPWPEFRYKVNIAIEHIHR